jgi:hypothetical protein
MSPKSSSLPKKPLKAANLSSARSKTPRAAIAADWIGQDSLLSQLAAQTGRLLKVQTLISKQFKLPHLSVVKVDDAEAILVVMVSNAGQAAKLRQLEPEIIGFLRQAGWEFSRIKVRPQTVFSTAPVVKLLPRQPIPAQALTHILSTSANLPDGPIKFALTNLLKNSRKSSNN